MTANLKLLRTVTLFAVLAVAGCGSGVAPGRAGEAPHGAAERASPEVEGSARAPQPQASRNRPPHVVAPSASDPLPIGWQMITAVHGRPSVATRSVSVDGFSITLVRFDAASTRLVLHPGYQDPGGYGWPTRSMVDPAERPRLVAAFNGGFKLNAGVGGMQIGDRQAGALQTGLASVVTYADGGTQIGGWLQGVPQPGRAVASVRQNLHLLVANARPAADVDVIADWGAMLFAAPVVARSALGIDARNNLIWAGSTASTPRALADALMAAGVTQAIQLDINPFWVCAFSFTPTTQTALLPGQQRPVGTYLTAWTRDFFTVDGR